MATAHPAKFPEVVRQVLPNVQVGHESLQALVGLPTRKENLNANIDDVKAFIVSRQRDPG
jgi:threonine synthase